MFRTLPPAAFVEDDLKKLAAAMVAPPEAVQTPETEVDAEENQGIDAGGGFAAEADPARDCVRHAVCVLFTIDNQVRSLRKRQAVEALKAGVRKGTYWTIAADVARDYQITTPFDCNFKRTSELAAIDTRLKKLDTETQERLINWGYAVSDLGMRQYVDNSITANIDLPFSDSKI